MTAMSQEPMKVREVKGEDKTKMAAPRISVVKINPKLLKYPIIHAFYLNASSE